MQSIQTLGLLSLIVSIAAFLLCAFRGYWIIPILYKFKFGQTILDIGPSWHKKKQGTPTMGGLFFIGAWIITIIVAICVCEFALHIPVISKLDTAGLVRFYAGIGLALCSSAIGFADDYIKVIKKRNLGLTDKQKMFLQIVLSAIYAGVLYGFNASRMYIPFIGETSLGIWFVPLCMFFVVGFNNATNLTDGVDGLCGAVTMFVSAAFALCSILFHLGSQTLLAASLFGAMAGYLIYNVFPAKVMMGDTGSLFIGGVLVAIAFGIGHPLLLIPFGIIYIIETLSVMLQVSYFKITHGKRLFKMAPIHHHFELCGWNENKIVTVFCLVTLVISVLTIGLCRAFLW